MTEEEWAKTLEYIHGMENRYGTDALYGYGTKGPRITLYFENPNGVGSGELRRYTRDNVTLRVQNQKGGTDREERNFRYQQLRTREYYAKRIEELHAAGKMYTLVCKACGKVFESENKDRVTCCSRRTKALQREGGQKNSVRGTGITVSSSTPMTEEERQRVCPACGMTFRAKRRRQKCCSLACNSKWRNKMAAMKKETVEVKDILGGCKL